MISFYKKGAAVLGSLTLLAGLTVVGITARSANVQGSGTFTTIQATSTADVQQLNVTSTATVKGAMSLGSTLSVPAGLATLSSLSVTGTSALAGAVTLSSTLASPAGLATLSSVTVTGTTILGSSGASITGSQTAILTLSPNEIAGYQCTSTETALTGAVSGNAVLITPPLQWTTSTVMFKASGFGGTATIQMCNTSGTAITLTPASALRVTTIQY